MDDLDKFAREFSREMVFRQMQGQFENDEVGDGVCASLSYMWVTEKIDQTFRMQDWHSINPGYMFKGLAKDTAIGRKFPHLTVPMFHAQTVRPGARFKQAMFSVGQKTTPGGGFAELGRHENRPVNVILELKGPSLSAADIPEYIKKNHGTLHNGFGILGWSGKGRGHAVAFQAKAKEFQWYDANFGQFQTSSWKRLKELINSSFHVADYKYSKMWLYKVGQKRPG